MSSDPFKFWYDNQEMFAPLPILVQKYHSAPMGSMESERLFATASQTITPIRSSMSEETLEKLLFLHHNIKLVNYQY